MPHWRGDWGERETFVPSTPPWLTLTHSQGYLFLLSAKKYFERPFAAYTLGVSGKVQSLKGWPQDSLLRSWRATNHGPLPFLAHRRIWLKIVASQQSLGNKSSSLHGNWVSNKLQEIWEARFPASDKQASPLPLYFYALITNRPTTTNIQALPREVGVWELHFLKTWVGNHFGGTKSQPGECIPDSLVSAKEDKNGNTVQLPEKGCPGLRWAR